MIVPDRNKFEKEPPGINAIKLFIFCEGEWDEERYFHYFREMDSRIDIQPVTHKKNHPMGLYEKACELTIATEENPKPHFDFNEIVDQLWFVIDTDLWKNDITQLRSNCQHHKNWCIAQSNPCFELWKYYHIHADKPDFEGMEKTANWKNFIHQKIENGFDWRKHTSLIDTAITNSKQNFRQDGGQPEFLSTEMHFLGELIWKFVKEKIRLQRLAQIP